MLKLIVALSLSVIIAILLALGVAYFEQIPDSGAALSSAKASVQQDTGK